MLSFTTSLPLSPSSHVFLSSRCAVLEPRVKFAGAPLEPVRVVTSHRPHRTLVTSTAQPLSRSPAVKTKVKRDVRTVRTLSTRPDSWIGRFLLWLYRRNDLLKAVYQRVSPEMPSDLVATRLPDAIPSDSAAVVNCYNYDEGHAGRFTVPAVTDQGGSLSPSYVIAQTDFQAYIGEHLTYEPPVPSTSDKIVLFSPGLNTIHQPYEDELTAPARARYYTKVLQVLRLSQIHMGTSFDQPDVVVDGSSSPVLSFLFTVAKWLMPDQDLLPEKTPAGFVWDSTSIDSIQTGLSALNLVDTPLKVTYRSLLAKTEKGESVTLMAYSRASIELKSALDVYIAKCLKNGETKEEIELRLRQHVTVVTAGTPTSGFPDGPMYIHTATRTDSLNSGSGVNERRTKGAGKDAIFLNCDSPFSEKCVDNHNIATSVCQYLSIIFAYNGVSSFSELWALAQKGHLKTPDNISELIVALVVVTNGLDWLWDEENALQDVPLSTFPPHEQAVDLLTKTLGAKYVEGVVQTFQE